MSESAPPFLVLLVLNVYFSCLLLVGRSQSIAQLQSDITNSIQPIASDVPLTDAGATRRVEGRSADIALAPEASRCVVTDCVDARIASGTLVHIFNRQIKMLRWRMDGASVWTIIEVFFDKYTFISSYSDG